MKNYFRIILASSSALVLWSCGDPASFRGSSAPAAVGDGSATINSKNSSAASDNQTINTSSPTATPTVAEVPASTIVTQIQMTAFLTSEQYGDSPIKGTFTTFLSEYTDSTTQFVIQTIFNFIDESTTL